ncbi:hypothetical protein BU15DRAFT_65698 [Melanogaster broomeanus]|nr:hypothetical protein BU15DRAFT_65698 [Melanogaster broomeanus]
MPAKITTPMSIRNLLQGVKWLRAVVTVAVLRPLVRLLVILLRRGGNIWKLARSCFNSCLAGFQTRIEPSTTYVTHPSLSHAQASTPDTISLPRNGHHAEGQPHPEPPESPAINQHTPPGPVNTAATLSPIPVVPEQIPRHERRKLRDKTSNNVMIEAGKFDYSENGPAGWKRTVQPEGACYFFNADKHVFTDIDLTTPGNLADIEEYITFLRDKESKLQILSTASCQTQLVIQLIEVDGFRAWCYYFIDHNSHVICKVLLWIVIVDMPLRGSTDHINEVWGIMSHAYADRLTSASPLSTLDEDQLGKILNLVPYLQVRLNKFDGYALWIIASVKLYNFYGQLEARLEANLSVHPEQEESSSLFLPLDFLLFFAPSMHIKELEGIKVDNVINFARWKSFAKKLNIEWNSFTIYSTVMLAVDISFLALPSVGSASVAIVATYMSLLSVAGSLISSVLLARQSGAQENSVLFISNMSCWGGSKTLGVIFGLPFALLIWAMVFFVLALCYVIFHSSNIVVLGIMMGGVVLIVTLTFMPVCLAASAETLFLLVLVVWFKCIYSLVELFRILSDPNSINGTSRKKGTNKVLTSVI